MRAVRHKPIPRQNHAAHVLRPVLFPARRILGESEYLGRVAHSYRSNHIFRKPHTSHFGNDVLEDVSVTVPAISDKPVLRGNVLTNYDFVGIAGVGHALDVVQPLGIAGHVDVGERIVRPLIAKQVPFKVTARRGNTQKRVELKHGSIQMSHNHPGNIRAAVRKQFQDLQRRIGMPPWMDQYGRTRFSLGDCRRRQ